ncbi:hypothetical protein [Massilia sp. YIM B02769]|uniref:hypothetical protein n=1 Tax=Massilia sp. YIM B02769 TaxID=3050129 RepID=UPI0025B6BE83|nr:hypothetical protein [Massilia sp. YIM B02769]
MLKKRFGRTLLMSPARSPTYPFLRRMRPYFHVLLACLAISPLACEASEDYLSAPDRIEWIGGALYDGVFGDGTGFQMELGYPFPPNRGGAAGTKFHPSYWYPKFYQGSPIPLGGFEYAGNPMPLVRSVPDKCYHRDEEYFSISLAPDMATGNGHWKSVSLNKELDFSLQREVVYKSILVRRPFRNRLTGHEEAANAFEYSAVFPVVGEAEADAWIREQARICEHDRQCLNRIRITWKSRTLLSIHAAVSGYNRDAPSSESYELTRHYQLKDGHLLPLDFASFIKPDRVCRARMSKAIVASLRARKAPWAAKAGLKDGQEPAFTPTPTGIAFHFDWSEVKGDAEGEASAFVALKPNDPCVLFLPAYDKG